jgi:hypothetical protein
VTIGRVISGATSTGRFKKIRAAGDSEEAARLADVLGYLLVVLDPSQADLSSTKLVLVPFRLALLVLRVDEIEPVHGKI